MVYATFIVALVFVPLLTLGGVAGKLFAPLGLAYILAILASLVVALTPHAGAVLPAACAQRDLKSADPPAVAWLKPRYRRLLERIERFPARVVSVVFVVIAIGHRPAAVVLGRVHPGAARRPLHHAHDRGARNRRVGVAAHRPAASRRPSVRSRECSRWRNGSAVRPNGADTFGTHYSEFEVEIGALPGKEQERILREIRETLSGAARRRSFPA